MTTGLQLTPWPVWQEVICERFYGSGHTHNEIGKNHPNVTYSSALSGKVLLVPHKKGMARMFVVPWSPTRVSLCTKIWAFCQAFEFHLVHVPSPSVPVEEVDATTETFSVMSSDRRWNSASISSIGKPIGLLVDDWDRLLPFFPRWPKQAWDLRGAACAGVAFSVSHDDRCGKHLQIFTCKHIYIYIYVPDIIYLYIYIHTYYKDKTSYLDYICIIFHIYFMQRISSLSLTPPPPILLPTNKLQAASVTGPKPCSSGGEPLSGLRQRETTPTPPIRYSHLWKLHLRKVPFWKKETAVQVQVVQNNASTFWVTPTLCAPCHSHVLTLSLWGTTLVWD